MVIDWTFSGTWPYAPRWFDTSDGRIHYVDEGPRDGRPVVLLHGNPTWGYLYRRFIGPLTAAGYRAIVPDHLGFGRSDKPTRPALYTIRRHAERLEAFLESLDRCASSGSRWPARSPSRDWTTWSSRTPILVFPREIPAGPEGPVSDLLDEIEAGLGALADRPIAIVWAMRDIAFTPQVLERLWLWTFPTADVTRLEDSGHYLQEDAHERIVPALVAYLQRVA